jgi:twitching motility protein PilT
MSPSNVERLLNLAWSGNATALYLTTDASPFVRVDSDMRALDGEPPMSAAEVEAAVLPLMPESAREGLRRGEPTEWVADLADVGGVRCSSFRDHRGPGAIFQFTSGRPVSSTQLGLPAEIQALATEFEGLVLVASPHGHGKTTIVGALVDQINRHRSNYVITLERQIRLVHEQHRALISQREVRAADQAVALARAALRETPDVLVIEDLLTAEMFQVALEAADAGLLVIASVDAPSTTAALSHLIDGVAAERRSAVQSLLADRFRGAVAQVLLRKATGGRVAAREVLLPTAAVTKAISEGHLEGITHIIESESGHGLMSMTQALVHYVSSGAIDVREAYRKATDREALLTALQRESVDVSAVAKLA